MDNNIDNIDHNIKKKFEEVNKYNIKEFNKMYNYDIKKLNEKYDSKRLLQKVSKFKVNNLERITIQNDLPCSKCNKIPTYINKKNNELLCWYHGLLEHSNN